MAKHVAILIGKMSLSAVLVGVGNITRRVRCIMIVLVEFASALILIGGVKVVSLVNALTGARFAIVSALMVAQMAVVTRLPQALLNQLQLLHQGVLTTVVVVAAIQSVAPVIVI